MGGGYGGRPFHGGCFLGGREISMKGAPDFPELFKKDQKLNKKKLVFSTESKEQH